jgi:hypothetical protein
MVEDVNLQLGSEEWLIHCHLWINDNHVFCVYMFMLDVFVVDEAFTNEHPICIYFLEESLPEKETSCNHSSAE